MKKIIINVIKGAKINTTIQDIEDVCGIPFEEGSSSVFREKKQKKRSYFDEDESSAAVKVKELELSMDFGKLVLDYIKKIKKAILAKQPAPATIWVHERACFALRVTILRDKWYENKQKTRKRSDFIFRIHHLFVLQMYIRFWRRMDFIMNKPTDDPSGIWCTYNDFYNNTFYVDNHADTMFEKEDIIRNWNPKRVARALRTLRLLRAQGVFTLETNNIRDLFYEYTNALYDRIAMLATTHIFERLEDINPPGRTWFRLVGGALKDSGATFGDNSHRVYTKEIRKYFKAEDEEYIKLRMLEEDVDQEEDLHIDETAEARTKRLLPKIRRAQLNKYIVERDEYVQIRKQIITFEGYEDINDEQWNFLPQQNIDPTLDDIDRREVNRLSRKIHQLNKIIVHLQKKVDDLEKQYGIKYAQTVRAAITNNKKVDQICEIDTHFAQDFSLLVDSIVIWQEPHDNSVYYDTLTEQFVDFHERLKETISKRIKHEGQFLLDCTNWIITQTVTSFEREEYRVNFSGGGVFSLMSVVTAQRSAKHTTLPDFPENLETLLVEHRNEYFLDANNYFTFWWIGQNLSGLKSVSTVFFFDAEEEALSIDHVNLKSPVISRLGETWVIIEEGPWIDKYGIKCIRVGKTLSEALVVWMIKIAKKHWVIHDREKDMLVDIRNCQLRDVWKDRKEAENEMDIS